MTALLVDTSVLIKWFHRDGESEVREARALRDAHVVGDIDVYVIDLAIYELGNVLIRALGWPASDVADQIDDLREIVGRPLALSAPTLRLAAALAEQHTLTYYDAAWAAAAQDLEVSLVSADRHLIQSALAESATEAATRLKLSLAD